QVKILDDISLSLESGDILGLTGANGVGKSTLLKVIASLVTPEEGRVEVLGRKVEGDSRSLVGLATGEERSLFFRLTGRQNLAFFARLYGINGQHRDDAIAHAIEMFNLGSFIDRPVIVYSAGMRARLGLARATLHSPSLLLLDEPTKSLDA